LSDLVRFGVHAPNFGVCGEIGTLTDLAREAEAAGWDGFFLWDHVLGDPAWREPMLDPTVALSAIAVVTARVRIGALVTAVPRRRPWKLARELTTLDHLSNGRLVFGVGLGWPADAEYEHFGEETDARLRARKLDEGLDIIVGLWSGEPFEFRGGTFQVQPTVFLPTPIQRPRPPIWVAAHWPNQGPIRRAARWDGVFPEKPGGARLSPAELHELVQDIAHRRTSGDSFDVVVAGSLDEVTPSELRAYQQAGATWWLHPVFGQSLEEARRRLSAGPTQ
jgi:alkanesulfonate monooxygenase SsuD/methylene tetrahydromethanopterin reductase-like flavin-dependent oxidoreductase (luciferase family)